MASPQRKVPDQLPTRPSMPPDVSPPVQPAPAYRRDRRDSAFGWWWIWVILFIAGVVWFCGWGWFGYGGWWSHSRGTAAPTYQTQQVKPAPGTAANGAAANGAAANGAARTANTTPRTPGTGTTGTTGTGGGRP